MNIKALWYNLKGLKLITNMTRTGPTQIGYHRENLVINNANTIDIAPANKGLKLVVDDITPCFLGIDVVKYPDQDITMNINIGADPFRITVYTDDTRVPVINEVYYEIGDRPQPRIELVVHAKMDYTEELTRGGTLISRALIAFGDVDENMIASEVPEVRDMITKLGADHFLVLGANLKVSTFRDYLYSWA